MATHDIIRKCVWFVVVDALVLWEMPLGRFHTCYEFELW